MCPLCNRNNNVSYYTGFCQECINEYGYEECEQLLEEIKENEKQIFT